MCIRPGPNGEYFYSMAFSFNNESLSLFDEWNPEWDASPMVWDERRNVLVKYGGSFWTYCYPQGPNGPLDNRMREFDGTTWTLRLDIPEPLPPTRCNRLIYDEARGVVVLIHLTHCDTRYCYPPSCSTWEYDGKRWRDVTKTAGSFLSDFYLQHRNDDYLFIFPPVVYDSAHNKIALFQIGYDYEYGTGERKELWYLEDDATTQTYSRRNVMEEGCEMRTWGETGVDCSFTSSSTWSRIIMVKTEDGSAPDFARDYATSGIWAAPVLWEIKTDRPPDVCAAETTGTLVSISYPTGMVDCISSSTEALRLCVARPVEPIGVPIADTGKNSDRAYGSWQIMPQIDHPPAPGEYGVFHDAGALCFLFRTTMEPPFYGSPAGAPRDDGKPASLCYAIIATAPDYRTIIKNALLHRYAYTPAEKRLLDQNADTRLDIADLITLVNK